MFSAGCVEYKFLYLQKSLQLISKSSSLHRNIPKTLFLGIMENLLVNLVLHKSLFMFFTTYLQT